MSKIHTKFDSCVRSLISSNPSAFYEYEIIEFYEAALVLRGPEVKSLRFTHPSLRDAYCTFNGDELFMHNLHIAEYKFSRNFGSYEAKRTRKLLLRRRELSKLIGLVNKKHMTIVPIKLYFNHKNFVKILICLARGKNQQDKRNVIRDREIRLQISRDISDAEY